MSQSLRKQFSTTIASTILNDIQYQRSSYYYFLGKLEPWGADDRPEVTVQELSEYEDVAIRNNSAYFKKITPNDVSLVCPRYDWTMNTVYQQWDDSREMDGSPFYVLTSDDNVYKCLDNNNNAASIVMPTGNNLQPFKTSDGYTWKYMYNVPSFKKTRFMSVTHVPVQRALSDSFYNQGSIESVTITNGGSGYADTNQTTISVTGATTGTGAKLSFTVTSSGSIATVSIVNGGSGYTKGALIVLNSLNGKGAVIEPTITSGIITGITIVNPGVGYSTTTDAIAVIVGGAVLVPFVSNTGSITDVKIVSQGAGYTEAPTLTIQTTSGTATGMYEGNVTAIVDAIISNGKIQRVTISDPGVNYASDISTEIVIQGDGVGLELTPVIYNGEIVDVIVENPGYGYTNVSLSVIGTGTGAELRPIYANSNVMSDQSVIEQVSVDGAIYSVVVTDGGAGYTGTTTVNIIGDGDGATANAIVSGGQVTQVVMTSWGSGYTRASIQFSDANRVIGTELPPDAKAYAILPPGNGHGTDAIKELYGRTLAVASSIRSDPMLTKYQQDFRQFGLITQPRNILSGKLSTVDFDFNVYAVEFNTIVDIVIDEVLVFDNHYRYRVVFVNGTSVFLQPLQKAIVDPIGTLVAESNINRVYTATSLLTRPIINKHTGNLLYVANEQPFEFTETQGLLIKTYFRF